MQSKNILLKEFVSSLYPSALPVEVQGESDAVAPDYWTPATTF